MISSASSRVNARSVSVCSAPWWGKLRDDLERGLVVGGLEDLDHVVAAERHPDADELPAGLLDLSLAVLDPVTPRRQSHPSLRRPAHQVDVVRHAHIFSGCA